MTFTFWGIATVMVAFAISCLVIPLKNKQLSNGRVRLIVAAFIPIIALGLYAMLGSPDLASASRDLSHANDRASAPRSNERSGRAAPSIGSLVDGLKMRLEQEPEDAGGWLLLAQSYQHLGQAAEAHAAYQRAKALGKTDPKFEASPFPKEIATASMEVITGPVLRGRVELADEYVDQVEADDTIFIFAKESREHRMPIVALRKPASELPIEFKLTNAEAMIAGTDLANYQSLVVNARISRSGMATDDQVGLEAWSALVSPTGDHFIELVISPSHELPSIDYE